MASKPKERPFYFKYERAGATISGVVLSQDDLNSIDESLEFLRSQNDDTSVSLELSKCRLTITVYPMSKEQDKDEKSI